jgi:hypothetical protein
MEVCPEIAETGLTEIFLESSDRRSYCLSNSRGSMEVFQAKIRVKHAVRMHSSEAEALFQLQLGNYRRFGEIMEKDEKARSLNLTLFAMLLFLLSSVSCTPLLIGQAAYQGVGIVAVAASMEDSDKLKDSVKAFNEAFRFEDYEKASVFVSPDKKEKFWSEVDGFNGKIRIAEYELRDMQPDEKKNHATAIVHFQYWRTESLILNTVSITQKWQCSEKDKAWRVSDSGFAAFFSNSH